MSTKEERREKWKNAGKDKVILHMLPRARNRPNGSPFVLKFETFLRMANINYEVDFEEPMSKKNKTPWMTFNGEDYADSQFCIDLLVEKLDKDLSKKMSSDKRAIQRSMRLMLENDLYWCLVTIAFHYQKGKYLKSVFPPLPVPSFMQGFVFNMMMSSMGKQAKAQGIGRHSQEEAEKLAIADLKALSDYMADKPYIMGKEPTELDAVAFGFLCIILVGDPEDDNSIKKAIETDFTNLKGLFERIKEKFWPDWDECVYVDLKKQKKEEEKKKHDEEEAKKKEEEAKKKEEKEKEKKKKEEEQKEKEKKEKKDAD